MPDEIKCVKNARTFRLDRPEMAYEAHEMKFLATPEKGEVSALLIRPGDASHLLVLGHGASTNMRHATLQTIAERMADAGIATFRYNFPYMEHGRGRDSQEVCTATVRSAVAAAQAGRPRPPPPGRRPLLRRAHDLHGGLGIPPRWRPRPGLLRLPPASARQARHEARGPPGRGHGPDALPQRHARRAGGPGPSPTRLQEARQARDLHLLDTADHGFRTLKRSRKSEEDVFVEMARVVREWASRLK